MLGEEGMHMQGRWGIMKRVVVLSIFVVALALSSVALSAPKPGGYHGSAGNVQNAVGPAAPAGRALGATQAGQLPFTGADLIVFTALGLILVGAGLSMRRASRGRS